MGLSIDASNCKSTKGKFRIFDITEKEDLHYIKINFILLEVIATILFNSDFWRDNHNTISYKMFLTREVVLAIIAVHMIVSVLQPAIAGSYNPYGSSYYGKPKISIHNRKYQKY